MAGGWGSSCLRHYDALRTKIDMWLTPFYMWHSVVFWVKGFDDSFSIERINHQRCSVRKGVLRNFTKFTGKHLFQSLFLNKVAGLRSATLLKKRIWHRCFPENFAQFVRTPFLQNTSGRLVLNTVTNELDLVNLQQSKFKINFKKINVTPWEFNNFTNFKDQ